MIVKKLLGMVFAAFVLAGCATTGNDFSSNQYCGPLSQDIN